MASLDTESESVVVRIVYDGPPVAGKTTSLQALAQRFGQGALYTPEASVGGRTLFFDWLEYVGGRFDGKPIRCQLVSVPGQRELSPRRHALLASADAVVFVGDSTRSGLEDTRSHLDDLLRRLRAQSGPPVGVVFQANKRDLPDAVPIDSLRGQHGLGVIESIASRGEGIREAFVFAVRLALDRVRELHRLGLLLPRGQGSDPAAELLASLRSLPLVDAERELFPEHIPPPPPPSSPGATSVLAPRLPDATIPSGWVWPPINGRILLQEATARGSPVAQELSPREWVADSPSGWRFHSPPGGAFGDHESARAALIHWAQVHASLATWMSPHRCVALSETEHGYRLWQVVRLETTVWKRLADALRSRDTSRISRLVTEAAELCARASDHWSRAPWELPCTLETVSALDGSFVSLVPEARSVRPPEPVDRRARLWHQLETLLRGELGVEGHAFANVLRPT